MKVYFLIRIFFSIFLSLLVCGNVSAAGFGFAFGDNPESYGCTATDSTGVFSCASAKKHHSAFESYRVKASDEHGICLIQGVGKTISDNKSGFYTKSAANDLVKTLSKAYGEPQVIDRFHGSLWDGYDEWLMAIAQKERTYMNYWEDLKVASKPNLDEIYLEVNSLGSDKGWLTLEYYASNYDACNEAIKDSESGAL